MYMCIEFESDVLCGDSFDFGDLDEDMRIRKNRVFVFIEEREFFEF